MKGLIKWLGIGTARVVVLRVLAVILAALMAVLVDAELMDGAIRDAVLHALLGQ